MSTELLLLLALCSHGEGSNKNEDASRGPMQGDHVCHAAWDGASSTFSEGLCLAAQRVHCDAEYGRELACAASAASYPMRGMSTEHLLFLALCWHGEGSNKNEDASRGRIQGDAISHVAWDGTSSTCSEVLCLRRRSALIVTQRMVGGSMCGELCVLSNVPKKH